MSTLETQELLNKMGLAMANTILSTKPDLDLTSDKPICPYCESSDKGRMDDESLANIQHTYGCIYLTAVLFKEEMKDLKEQT